MEVAVRMEAVEKDGSDTTIMLGMEKLIEDSYPCLLTPHLGRFCMVARDARTQKSKTVNPLILETPEDRTLFNIGESTKRLLSRPIYI